MSFSVRRVIQNPVAHAVVLLLLGGLWSRGASEPIRWYRTLQQAAAAAQEANKPIMIEFWAEWCAPCKVMDAEVYTDSSVAAAVEQKLIPLRVHFDNEKALVRHYNVEAIPFLVFTSSYGTELLHHRGLLGAGELAAVIRALPADVSDFNRWDRVLQKDSGNVDALENMASRLRAAGLYQSSNEFYEKAVKLDSVKKNSALRQALLREMGLNFLDLRDGKKAASIFERCIKESPNTRERPIFLLGLGRAYALIKKKDDARKMLNAVISEFPNSQSAEEARKLLPEL